MANALLVRRARQHNRSWNAAIVGVGTGYIVRTLPSAKVYCDCFSASRSNARAGRKHRRGDEAKVLMTNPWTLRVRQIEVFVCLGVLGGFYLHGKIFEMK
jgi:hypothetical protein